MKKLFILLAFVTKVAASAQGVAISTNGSVANAAAILDLTSTTKGFLPPRMTTTQRDAIASPATGLVIYNTTVDVLQVRTSNEWSSLTVPSDTVVTMSTIVIGTQQWMRENLDVLTYRNGDIIPQVTDATLWAALNTGAWCYYNNDAVAFGRYYGKLYNWYAVTDSRGLAPKGWHVPTDPEWTTLTNKLGGDSVAGGKMKSTSTLWNYPNSGATNESGFTGLPGNYRHSTGSFPSSGIVGTWWSSSELTSTYVYFRELNLNDGIVNRGSNFKSFGYSVRCLRD